MAEVERPKPRHTSGATLVITEVARHGRGTRLEVVGHRPQCRYPPREPPATTYPRRRGVVFSEPKNASRRTIDLPQKAVEALRSYRKRQLEEKKLRASVCEASGLVFSTTVGTPVDVQNIIDRHFKPLLKRAGLPDIRWHDLRHSCFIILLARGTHPKYVHHLAGHASIQLTLVRYSHWMPSMGRNTADGMDEALG